MTVEPRVVLSSAEIRRRIGLRLVAARVACRWSQRALARRVGVQQPSVSNYERGEREVPLVYVLRLAEVTGVAVEDLVRLEDLDATL